MSAMRSSSVAPFGVRDRRFPADVAVRDVEREQLAAGGAGEHAAARRRRRRQCCAAVSGGSGALVHPLALAVARRRARRCGRRRCARRRCPRPMRGGAITSLRHARRPHRLAVGVEREHVALVGADDDAARRRRRRRPRAACLASMRQTHAPGRRIDAHERAVASPPRRRAARVIAGAKPGAALPTLTCQLSCGVRVGVERGSGPGLCSCRTASSTTARNRHRRQPRLQRRAAARDSATRSERERATRIVSASRHALRGAAGAGVPRARAAQRPSRGRCGRSPVGAARCRSADGVELHLHVAAIGDFGSSLPSASW